MEKKSAACILGGDAEADVPIRSLTRRMKPIIGTSYLSSSTVVSDTETKKNKMELYRPWSQLPDHMIEMVYGRLDFIEKFRFASVCATWRDGAPESARRRPQQLIPWLLFSHDTQSKEVSFFNLPESMIYHVSIPQINMGLCYGSSEGWLFMFSDEQDELCFLLNPFTKSRIQLPPFNLESPQSVLKVILSSDPVISEDWMVVAHIACRGLIYCKSGDGSWSIGPPKSKVAFSFDDGDIIFSSGVVYALGMLKSLWVFNMKTQAHVLKGGGLSAPYDLHRIDDSIEDEDGFITYLVESNGELLLVARFLKDIKKKRPEFENALPEGVVDECQTASHQYKTFKFLLYKLKENDNERLRMDYVWVKQSSLGADTALFLSSIGSKSVSTIESPLGIHSNSIYFVNDLHPNTGELCDIGIYHVENDRIEPFIPFDSDSFKFPSIWVTPSI